MQRDSTFSPNGNSIVSEQSNDSLNKEWSENLDGFSNFESHSNNAHQLFNEEKDSIFTKTWRMVSTPCLLVLIGFSSAVVSYLTTSFVSYATFLKVFILGIYDPSSSYLPFLLIWGWITCSAMLSSIVTNTICSDATGGGIPEIKTILSGVVKPVLLSKRLIIAKSLGLMLATSSGLSVGKEGPFVHISAAIADQIMRFSCFKSIRQDDAKRLEILACACASGVAATFGTAFGGVLFSIELTSSVYSVRNLPRAFLTAVCAMMVFFHIGNASTRNAGLHSWFVVSSSESVEHQQSSDAMTHTDVILVVLFGVICGGLGVIFVDIVEILTNLRNEIINKSLLSQQDIFLRRYLMVFIMTSILAPFIYWEYINGMYGNNSVVIQNVFKPSATTTDSSSSTDLEPETLQLNLVLFCIYKFICTAFSVILPLPVGLFTPVFLTGGVVGRIFGLLVAASPNINTTFQPWEMAIIGAASFTTGVTRAISTAVIVYELSGQPHLRLPVSLAILAAYFTGNRFSKSVYDVLIGTNRAPYFLDMPRYLRSKPVSVAMVPIDKDHVLTLTSTYREALKLLQRYEREERMAENTHSLDISYQSQKNIPRSFSGIGQGDGNTRSSSNDSTEVNNSPSSPHKTFVSSYVIPVVNSENAMIIVGAVLRENLRRVLKQIRQAHSISSQEAVVLGEDFENGESDNDNSHGNEDESAAEGWQRLVALARGHSCSSNACLAEIEMNSSSLLSSSSSSSPRPRVPTLEATPMKRSITSSRGASWSTQRKKVKPTNCISHSIYDETVQFILVSDPDNPIIPVASSRNKSKAAVRRNSWSTLSYAVALDPSPYQVVDTMQLGKVDLVFRHLKLNQAYVTRSGRLVGVITRSVIREYVAKHIKKPSARCFDLCSRIFSICKPKLYQPIPPSNQDGDDGIEIEMGILINKA